MDDNELRRTVKRLYPLSLKWAKRVDHMPTQQVYAIHLRQCEMEDEERILEEKKQQMREALLDEQSPERIEEYLQATLF